MDRSGANFMRCVDMIRKRLGARPLPVQIPIGSEDNFKGMIDLVEMKALVWDSDDKDAEWQVLDVTPDLADKLHITVPSGSRASSPMWRSTARELSTPASSMDDEAMDAYLDDGHAPSAGRAAQVPAQGHRDSRVHTRCCAAPRTRTRACSRCSTRLSITCRRPPTSPAIKTVECRRRSRSASASARTTSRSAALAFKVINDAYGALTFVRVYSGVLTKGASVQNSTRGKREKIGRMVEMFAKEANPIEEARAGDIIALVSLPETETGDTLCDAAHPVILERMRFPDPVISVSVQGEDQGRAGEIRHRARQDGSRRSFAASGDGPRNRPDHSARHGRAAPRSDARSHAHGIRRRRHHGRAAGRLSRDHHASKVDEQYVHKKQTGGSGQFAEVWIDFEPLERGAGFEFVDETVGGSVPREYVPSVEKGLKVQKEDGVLAHYPDRGLPRDVDRRQLPRRRLERADLRNRRQGVLPRSDPQGRSRSCSSR